MAAQLALRMRKLFEREIFVKLPLELQVLVIKYLDLRSLNRLRISCWATVRLFELRPELWVSDSAELLKNVNGNGVLHYWRKFHSYARALTLYSVHRNLLNEAMFSSIGSPSLYVLRKLVILHSEFYSIDSILSFMKGIGRVLHTLKITCRTWINVIPLKSLLHHLTALKVIDIAGTIHQNDSNHRDHMRLEEVGNCLK